MRYLCELPASVGSLWRLLIFALFVFLPPHCLVHGNQHAKNLYDDLLRKSGYNRLIRPVKNVTEKMTVKIGIQFSQLIDVVSQYALFTCIYL